MRPEEKGGPRWPRLHLPKFRRALYIGATKLEQVNDALERGEAEWLSQHRVRWYDARQQRWRSDFAWVRPALLVPKSLLTSH